MAALGDIDLGWRPATAEAREAELAALVYTSRATGAFDQSSLDSLIEAARSRNAAERVTGAVYYHDGRFLQWLEGPLDSVKRIATSINRDDRHTDIEILSFGATPARVFADWDMHLVMRRTDVPSALERFTGNGPSVSHGGPPLEAAIGLAEGDHAAAAAYLASSGEGLAERVQSCEAIIDAYAGLWASDVCGDLDITLGLCELLRLFRRLHRNVAPVGPAREGPSFLVAPYPYEPHHIGAALASELLIDQRRDVTYAFPRSDEEIIEQLERAPYGGVVLALSGVYAREHLAGPIRRTAEGLQDRFGPGFRIVVYGRMGLKPPAELQDTGLYGCCCSANDLPLLLEPAEPVLH
ncbi:MAG: BLUF domain-containing protein [Pseudomonadota bacterium]